ncbi:MAG: ATP-dependent Clp protease adaptor ClpS [Chloroflexota bacterium]|jgi:ATP-dependent Clp protease adaptor protein ClpS
MVSLITLQQPEFPNLRTRLYSIALGVNRTSCSITGDSSNSADTSNPVRSTPAEVEETSGGRSDRWAVVLINDNYHSVDFVIWALKKIIPGMTDADAVLITMETHNTGKGVATVCGRTQAEEYRDKFRVLQLGCEVEPGW